MTIQHVRSVVICNRCGAQVEAGVGWPHWPQIEYPVGWGWLIQVQPKGEVGKKWDFCTGCIGDVLGGLGAV